MRVRRLRSGAIVAMAAALLQQGCGDSGTGPGTTLSFQALTASNGYTCGLAPGGAAYCWGYNGRGQLGDGTLLNRVTPVDTIGF